MTDSVQKVATGIKALVSEHGTPNSFTASEIGTAGGLSQMRVGKVVWQHHLQLRFWLPHFVIEREQRDGYTYVNVSAREVPA